MIQSESETARLLAALHKKWIPHPGQIPIGRAIFAEGKTKVFAQPGRGFGKSEVGVYCGWRRAIIAPGSAIYYVAPFYSQAKEIVWSNRRLQTFGPESFVKRCYNQDCRVVFKNGSFIKLLGSDNTEAGRGYIVDMLILDELKDFEPGFWPAMRPNLLKRKDAIVLCLGTPPDNDVDPGAELYLALADEYRNDPKGFWCTAPSDSNPYLDQVELQKEIDLLRSRGQHDVVEREFYGRYVKGGSGGLIPHFRSGRHVRGHAEIVRAVERDRYHLDFHVIADPGSAVCFAVLFAALNRVTNRVYFLDEIYSTDPKANTTTQIWSEICKRCLEWGLDLKQWNYTYDEQARWFWAELAGLGVDVGWTPTHKQLHKKELGETKPGLSALNDMFRTEHAVVSDRCKKFVWEMESYIKTKEGNIPKKRDNLIDCGRYFIYRTGYESKDIEYSDVGVTPSIHNANGVLRAFRPTFGNAMEGVEDTENNDLIRIGNAFLNPGSDYFGWD